MFEIKGPSSDERARAFHDFIKQNDFPCVGAKAALTKGQIDMCFPSDIRSNWHDIEVAEGLIDFAEAYKAAPRVFRSFAVIYAAPASLGEQEFERCLWERVQSFSDKDALFGSQPDPRVASDPRDPHFSLSFGGEAFFVVGLHPRASRPARRFAYPALIFNAHQQFEELRRQGRYEGLRDSILERDVDLAGSVNPMLARHGESSEARQYSGRRVDEDWACPFERRDYGPLDLPEDV